jgi:hypothetical protein
MRWLIVQTRPFPTTAGMILDIAKYWKFDKATIAFLERYPADLIFESEADFIDRSDELETLILEERDMPVEFLLTAQD